ncbi:MAG: alpha/beta hydrolase [Candidatus Bipolaricaulia bacterium]
MLRRVMRWGLVSLLGVLTSLSLASSPLAQSEPTYRVTVQTDIAYYRGADFNSRRHALDVYQPAGLNDAPVLIFVHGGGWSTGNKQIFSYIGRTFAERGYVTVVPNYRLSPTVQHPAHVRDVARAYAWTVANIGQYGGDPTRVVLSGHSAGGHLVSLLTVNERYLAEQNLDGNAIQGVISISGIYDVTSIPPGILSSPVFTSSNEARRDASPIFHVDEGEPPFRLMYARFDLPTLDRQAREFHTRLRSLGVASNISQIDGRSHATIVLQIGNPGDPTTEEMLAFLKARTREPEVMGREAE